MMTDQTVVDETNSTPANMELKTLVRDAVMEAFREVLVTLPTRQDIEEVKARLSGVEGRLVQAEENLDKAGSEFARKSDVDMAVNTWESRNRQLTTQVAELTNFQSGNNQQFQSIQSKIDELSGLKSVVGTLSSSVETMSGNLNSYMESGRERLKNHDERISREEHQITELRQEMAFTNQRVTDTEGRFVADYIPLRDFIKGSDTQKPLKSTIDSIEAAVGVQGQQLQIVADYVKYQKEKEATNRTYWLHVRTQLSTPTGVFALMAAILLFILIVNAINFEQLNERIRQFAETIQLMRGS